MIRSLRYVLDLTSVLALSSVRTPPWWCHRYYAGEREPDNKRTREQDLQFSPQCTPTARCRTMGSGGHDTHMRGVGRVSPVDQSLVRLVSDPSPVGQDSSSTAAWLRLCSTFLTDEDRSRGQVSR